ncbi:MAG TPA: PVC-type heme-binding CxxCH protein [Verrucomicrobiae bacterium]|nr:PVC-type heme-binding CxxCH protein [Verrucomicrobiae bacterium]
MKTKLLRLLLLSLLAALSLRASDFPAPYNSETDPSQALPAAQAAAGLTLPPGFKATVFAAEPDVQNPIAMAWDARGCLWVAENYTYAEGAKRFELNLRDRILIFEDKDNDGHFDSRKVFTDELQMLTSIEVGHGGVWAMCPPQLLFIPDRDRDGVPDGVPEVVLDGFALSTENHHTFANGLRFGPDGWLYGRCGASSPAEVGPPGSTAAQRVPVRGTIWRYHPQRKTVEALSAGCTNPWGHDWNEHGELFFINTVNGHLWHGITGAHFVRPHTIDPNPRTYALIDQHADHWHFDTAAGWSQSRAGQADTLGGGHAHIGLMCYLGDNWPAEYRGHLFTANLHGRRVNQEILERRGSGYVGHHGQDLFVSPDPWFRGMEVAYGPDGAVFVLDWSDTGECHESTGVHRTSGRIYKIAYGEPKRSGIGDVARLNTTGLVQLHTHANEWFSRQARLELATRAEAGRDSDAARQQLRSLFDRHDDIVVKLRALWTLSLIGGTDDGFLRAQLRHPNEHVRTWAVRLLTDTWPLDTTLSGRPAQPTQSESHEALVNSAAAAATLKDLIRLAGVDPSGLVRLALASTLQRLPVAQRAELAAPLLRHQADAQDHNLPLLLWYSLIPLAEADPAALAALAGQTQLPLTRTLIARRLSEDLERNPAPLNSLLELAARKPVSFQADIINGMADGLAGWRKANPPATWARFSRQLAKTLEPTVRQQVRDLNVLFADGRALDEVKRLALDKDADLNSRKAALQTLIASRAPEVKSICDQLLNEQFINSIAARGLAAFDEPAVATNLVKAYRRFHPSERGQLLSALVSRVTFAQALLDAVAEGKIPRTELTAFHLRQIRSLNDAGLNQKLTRAWGEFRETSADKQQLIAAWKTQLTAATLARANPSQGRQVFNATCAACHTLYGEGGKVGPDLTGGGRNNLDYLLENILDPSAAVTADFRMSVVELKDGRAWNGLITAKTERTLMLRTMTEAITVERNEVATMRDSNLSLMPDGLLEALPPEQARDLIAYLMHMTQVPLPVATASGSN